MNHYSSCFHKKMSKSRDSLCSRLSNLSRAIRRLSMNPFWTRIFYLLSVSFLGFLVLKALKPRTDSRNLDLFFTSVSAATLSSMSTVEMENFSNSQLIVMIIMMFIGGEVFTSMVALSTSYFYRKKSIKNPRLPENLVNSEDMSRNQSDVHLMHHSIKFLSFVVLGYLLVVNLLGVTLVSLYLRFVSSARSVLESKGLKLLSFSVFTTVSSFNNCGFVPTNENMLVFNKNPGLLFIITPLILLGNTLYPAGLRFSICVMGKIVKKVEKNSNYLFKNARGIEYPHLFTTERTRCLVVTVLGFLMIQVVFLLGMEWNTETLSGLSWSEKIIGALFQSVNTRQAGENFINFSTMSAVVQVMFVVIMYIPPYTSFPFVKDENEHQQKKRGKIAKKVLPQLAYVSIFVILICITERENIKEDPLNFTIFNIVFEVVSAYCNVGYTMGYSCNLRLQHNGICEDKWFGFVGRWSGAGKTILIVVMFFGRLKRHAKNNRNEVEEEDDRSSLINSDLSSISNQNLSIEIHCNDDNVKGFVDTEGIERLEKCLSRLINVGLDSNQSQNFEHVLVEDGTKLGCVKIISRNQLVFEIDPIAKINERRQNDHRCRSLIVEEDRTELELVNASPKCDKGERPVIDHLLSDDENIVGHSESDGASEVAESVDVVQNEARLDIEPVEDINLMGQEVHLNKSDSKNERC